MLTWDKFFCQFVVLFAYLSALIMAITHVLILNW